MEIFGCQNPAVDSDNGFTSGISVGEYPLAMRGGAGVYVSGDR